MYVRVDLPRRWSSGLHGRPLLLHARTHASTPLRPSLQSPPSPRIPHFFLPSRPPFPPPSLPKNGLMCEINIIMKGVWWGAGGGRAAARTRGESGMRRRRRCWRRRWSRRGRSPPDKGGASASIFQLVLLPADPLNGFICWYTLFIILAIHTYRVARCRRPAVQPRLRTPQRPRRCPVSPACLPGNKDHGASASECLEEVCKQKPHVFALGLDSTRVLSLRVMKCAARRRRP